MKLTHSCKDNPFGSFQNIDSQVIIIDDEIPKNMTLPECERFHEKEAEVIMNVLSKTLPQGTYDRLGIMFMQRKVSLYQGITESAF